jgi:protease-4
MLRFPIVLVRNLFSLIAYLWSTFWFKVGYFFRRKKKLYIAADLESDYAFGPPAGLAHYFQEEPSLLEIRRTLRQIETLDEVDGFVYATNGLAMGSGRTEMLTQMLDRLRGADKRVVAHMRMPTTNEYLLGTAAEEILLTPAGRLYTFGPRFDQFFGAEALDKVGVEPQIVHIGSFKTASHRMIHRSMTPPQEAMMESLHESLGGAMRRRIAGRRDLDEQEAGALFRNAPSDAKGARRAGLIDRELFRGRLETWLARGDETVPTPAPAFRHGPAGEQAELPAPPEPPADREASIEQGLPADAPPQVDGEEDDVMVVSLEDAAGVIPPELNWRPLLSPASRFAVMDLSGMIVMPDMGLPAGGSRVIDPEEVLPALKRIREDRTVAGLLLHINSPGGSALASDIIWEAIQRVRQHIPVVAYCSDVVGSGGYYLAVGADRIVCQSMTIAGSIGVVTGKMSAPDLPGKFGINVESIFDDEADLFTSLVHPLGDEMMDRLNDDAREFYRRFLQRVGQNRQLRRRRLHRYARGRVYMGEEAERRALVDQIGTFDDAIDALAELSGADREATKVDFVPHHEQGLRDMVGLQASVSAESLVPEQLWEPYLAAKMLEREHTLALMPWRPSWE